MSLERFLPRLQGRDVLVMTDNTTAVSCLRRQGSLRSEPLMSLTREILEFCFNHSIRIVTKHLPGRLNVLADQASRVEPVSTEWSLDDSTFGWLSREYGPFQVDLFATHLNAKLDAYVSPCPDKQACGINAFSLFWDRWDRVYLFPPTDQYKWYIFHQRDMSTA